MKEKIMKILTSISSTFIRFRKLFVCAVVIFVLTISLNWLWHMNKVLDRQSEWCMAQTTYSLDVCGGIAERDVQKTYYLKVLMLSVLAFGSTGLLLSISNKKQG